MTASIVTIGTPIHGGSGTVTVSWPTPHLIDDVLIIVIECDGNATPALLAPNGFQFLGTRASTGSAGGTSLSRFWARAWCTSMPDVVLNALTDHQYVIPILVRDATQIVGSTVAAQLGNSTKGTASTACTAPSINNVGITDTFHLAFITREVSGTGAFFSGWTNADVTGFAEIFDAGTTVGKGGGIGIATGTRPASGVVAASSATSSVATMNASQSTSLRPRAVAGNPSVDGIATEPRWINSKTTVNPVAATSNNLALPDNIVKNQILIAAVTYDVTAATISMANWTPIFTTLNNMSHSHRCFYRIATGDAQDAATAVSTASGNFTGVIANYSTASLSAPISAVATQSGSSTTIAPPTVTLTTNNCRAISIASTYSNSTIIQQGSFTVCRGVASNTVNNGGQTALSDESNIQAVGTTTARTYALTPSSSQWYGVTFAIQRGWIDEVTTTITSTTVVVAADYIDDVSTTATATTTVTDVYTPTGIPGCTIHLDFSLETAPHASTLTAASLTNYADRANNAYHYGGGTQAVIVIDAGTGTGRFHESTPGYSLRQNKVAHFGRGWSSIRCNGATTEGSYDISVIIVSRVFDVSLGGRTFANATDTGTPWNFLVGTWGVGAGGISPAMFDNGWIVTSGQPASGTVSWLIYHGNCSNSPRTSELYVFNGLIGSHALSNGHGHIIQLNGYKTPDGGVSDETCHGQIGEVIVYNRFLDATERTKIYNYIADKWMSTTVASVDTGLTYGQFDTSVVDVHTRYTNNYVDSVETLIVGTSNVADSFGVQVPVQTDITYGDIVTSTLGAVGALETGIIGQTECSVVHTFNESVLTIISSSTGIIDSQPYTDSISGLIVATTQTTDSKGFIETLQTTINATTYETDAPGAGGYVEFVQTDIVTSTYSTDVASFKETPQTTVLILTGVTEMLSTYFDATTNVLAITSTVEILGLTETPTGDIIGDTSGSTNRADFKSSVLTIINVETTETDSLNGEVPPVIEDRFLYQVGPLKVMGKI